MDLLGSDVFQWFRIITYGVLTVLTFYNALRFNRLMKLWFIFLGLFFLGLVGSVYLHIIDSPYYDKYVNGVFSPIVVGLTCVAIMLVIDHKIQPPFNRRKEDR